MPPATIKLGKQAGEHGSYAFYRSFSYMGRGKWRNVRLGKFFFVRLSKDSPICIGELQLVWTGRYSNHPLASIRLFYLPEQLPDGRQSQHGQDELVSTEKMVLHVKDLIKWIIYDGVDWSLGLSLPKGNKSVCTCSSKPSDGLNCNVQIIDFTSYCRLRTALKRAEGKSFGDIVNSAQLVALYGLQAIKANHYIMFCKETFECPELENHDYRCDHLAPNLKGRPRKKGKGKKGKQQTASSNASNTSSTTTVAPVEAEVEAEEEKPTVDPDKEKEKYEKMLKQSLNSKEFFTKTLYKHMKDQGTPITKIPSLGFKQVDLHLFFKHAHSVGGYKEICRKRLWKHLYDRMGGIPHNTSAATCTKRQYERLLLSFEKYVVRSNIASKGVLPASQMSKLKKMNMAVVHHRWARKPRAGSTMSKSLDTKSAESSVGNEIDMKGAGDELVDEDQIPLSKLRTEHKDTSPAANELTHSDVSKTVWQGKFSQTSVPSSTDVLKSATNPASATTGAGDSQPLCAAPPSAADSMTTGAVSTISFSNTPITRVPIIRPAHLINKSPRPLNILGPCHPRLLTAAQRSPWCTDVTKCYADPLMRSAQDRLMTSELKRAMAEEVLDLSAKKQKMAPPADTQKSSNCYSSVDDCGAIDLTINRDKPLSLVKVKSESSAQLNSWNSKLWKPQEEPLNFSKSPAKSSEPNTTRQLPPPPSLHREFISRTTAPSLRPTVPPASTVHSSISYPMSNAIPATAYLLPLPPTYTSAASSLYTQRTPVSHSISRANLPASLQMDLIRVSANSTGSRFLSPNNILPQAMLSVPTTARHNPSALSPQMPSSAHSSNSRHSEPPPRYGEHHRRELPYEVSRHLINMSADGRQASDSRPRMPLGALSIQRVRDSSPNRDGRLMSPHNTNNRPGEMQSQHNNPHTQLLGSKHREPNQAPPFLHTRMKAPESRPSSMMTSPRQMTSPAGKTHDMTRVKPFDIRRPEPHRPTSNTVIGQTIGKPPTLTGSLAPVMTQMAMTPRLRASTAPLYMTQTSPLNQRLVPAAHSHRAPSLSPKQSQPMLYASSSPSLFQERQSLSGRPPVEYPRFAIPRPLTTSLPRPEPLLQRLPTSLDAQAKISSALPAPPRLQPIPKPQYPPHSSYNHLYKS